MSRIAVVSKPLAGVESFPAGVGFTGFANMLSRCWIARAPRIWLVRQRQKSVRVRQPTCRDRGPRPSGLARGASGAGDRPRRRWHAARDRAHLRADRYSYSERESRLSRLSYGSKAGQSLPDARGVVRRLLRYRCAHHAAHRSLARWKTDCQFRGGERHCALEERHRSHG